MVNSQPTADCADQMAHYRAMESLTGLADYPGLLEYATRLRPTPGSFLAFYAAVFSGHARLALGIDCVRILAAAEQRERSSAWLTPDCLMSRLQSAIRAREPLSLIRLGDGEGRFLAHMLPWVRDLISEQEADCMLSFIWETWFGQPISAASKSDLQSLGDTFTAALETADILGVTPAERFKGETYRRGYLSVVECTVAEIVARHPEVALTSAFAHVEMQCLSPFFRATLSDLNFLGVISPHPGLAMRLTRYLGIVEFDEYIVQGESRLPEVARSHIAGMHFPNRFQEIMRSLHVPYRGAVFLVAAGLLGKVYCHRIRELGGIAIDTGSVVDAWMGFDSRPFDRIRRTWALPPTDTVSAAGGGAPRATAQKRFWVGDRHIWLDAADVFDGPPGGFLGPLLE